MFEISLIMYARVYSLEVLYPSRFAGWNMFFFLWGVFRGKKEKFSDPLKSKPLSASNVLPNMGRVLSTREGFYHENPSNREFSIDRPSSRMQSCLKVGASRLLQFTPTICLSISISPLVMRFFSESHMPFIILL